MTLEMKMTLLVCGAVAVGVFVVGVIMWVRARNKAWSQALDDVAREYRLAARLNVDYPSTSEIDGNTAAGHRVSVARQTRVSMSSTDTEYTRYEVSPAGLSGQVRVVPAGSWTPQVHDYSGGGDQKVETGVAELDQAYDVWNAKRSVLKRLRDPETVSELLGFLKSGGRIEYSNLIFDGRSIPTTAEEIKAVLEPMLALADRLS